MKRLELRAVIIDDELDAIIVLHELLTAFSAIKVVGTSSSFEEGINLIKATQPDIVFIDVNLKGRNGFEIYSEFKLPDFNIIFCSASEKYAREALARNASGYLLKPIDINDLQQSLQNIYDAFSKEIKLIGLENQHGALIASDMPGENILLEKENGFIVENTRNIEYCYAQKTTSVVVMNSKKEFSVPRTLKELTRSLPQNCFYRTHKLYVINIFYIQKFVRGKENYVLMESGTKIPVASRISSLISKDIRKKMAV